MCLYEEYAAPPSFPFSQSLCPSTPSLFLNRNPPPLSLVFCVVVDDCQFCSCIKHVFELSLCEDSCTGNFGKV